MKSIEDVRTLLKRNSKANYDKGGKDERRKKLGRSSFWGNVVYHQFLIMTSNALRSLKQSRQGLKGTLKEKGPIFPQVLKIPCNGFCRGISRVRVINGRVKCALSCETIAIYGANNKYKTCIAHYTEFMFISNKHGYNL